MLKTVKTINGNNFIAEVIKKEEINVLDTGYIITPTGECIKIEGDHNVKYGDYLNAYLENKKAQYYELFDAIQLLTSLHHVVYGGLRIEDIKEIKCGANISSLCSVFLPEGDLTSEQKEALTILRASNRSIINPIREKVTLNFFRMSSEVPLIEEEIQELLTIPPVEEEKIQRKKL